MREKEKYGIPQGSHILKILLHLTVADTGPLKAYTAYAHTRHAVIGYMIKLKSFSR